MRRSVIPATILLSIALGNRIIVATSDLSAWELGGFGMFSTLDAPNTRVLRLTVELAGGETAQLTGVGRHRELADQLRVWPTQDRAQRLADLLQADEVVITDGEASLARDGERPTSVRVEIFAVRSSGVDETKGGAALELELLTEASAS